MASGRDFKKVYTVFIFCAFVFIHPSEPAADAITEITGIQKNIRTMRAEFVQEKHSGMLEKPMTSKGTFLFSSPERFVWDYKEGIKVVSDGTKLLVYYKELKTADIIDASGFSALPGSFSIEKLGERYRIEVLKTNERMRLLKLTPIIKSMPLKEILITLDEKAAPSEVKMVERTGDSTVIRFTNMQINITIPEESFGMELPEGVKVRRH